MKRLEKGSNNRLGVNLTYKAIGVALCIYFVSVLLLMYIGQQFWGYSYDHQRAVDNLGLPQQSKTSNNTSITSSKVL